MAGLNNIYADVTSPDIGSYLSTLNGYANSAISQASGLASQLQNISMPSINSNVHFASVSSASGMGNPSRPSAPGLSYSVGPAPGTPPMRSASVSIGSVPTFTDSLIPLNFPLVPHALTQTLPAKDFTLDLDKAFPAAPNSTLPGVPTLRTLNLPTMADINLPTFSQAFPTQSLVVPSITFAFSEAAYSDALLTSVKNSLITRLAGGTGLTPAVEDAIWNRDRDREAKASLLAEQTLTKQRSQVGLTRPSGSYLAALDLITFESQMKITDLSREIAIKQAELEQENIKTTIQQVIALEDILIREWQGIQQRAFETAKYMQDLAIEIYKQQVGLYNVQVDAFKAYVASYEVQIKAELNKIEIYRAELEGQKLIGEINQQDIQIYLGRLEGIKTLATIYQINVQAVSEELKAEALKIEAYKTDVQAYGEAVQAKASEYNMYAEQIKGELAKVQIYQTQADVYAKKVEAYGTETKAKVDQANLNIDLNKLDIEKYKADIDNYMRSLNSQLAVYAAQVDAYKAQSIQYGAEVERDKAIAEIAVKQAENTIQANKYAADIGIQNANVTLEGLKYSTNAALEGKKAAAGVHAQIASSALSSMHVSASVSGAVSVEAQESHAYSGE